MQQMAEMKDISTQLDIAVIGGGPSGISACLEFSQRLGPACRVALFESDAELGGMPRSCPLLFGLRDLKRIYTGARYAHELNRRICSTATEIHTQTTVLKIDAGADGRLHRLEAVSPAGLKNYACRYLLLATGACEASRGGRAVPGTRPAGIFTTGSLQAFINTFKSAPGKRAVIVGSEHVALSCAVTLRRSGVAIAAMVEEERILNTYPWAAKAISTACRFPVYSATTLEGISGEKRVEGVALFDRRSRKRFSVSCDTVILTGRFVPYAPLIDGTAVAMDPLTTGPGIDDRFMTSVPGVFAAGNVLRGAEMHDICALEGRRAARVIAGLLSAKAQPETGARIRLRADSPVRYVVPQAIGIEALKDSRRCCDVRSAVTLQLDRTVRHPVLEARLGEKLLWRRRFRRLYGRKRVVLPVHKFNSGLIGEDRSITLRLKD